jgi:hypothetical protein
MRVWSRTVYLTRKLLAHHLVEGRFLLPLLRFDATYRGAQRWNELERFSNHQKHLSR